MTAAHHIALLLLSTAREGSREHLEIIQQNGRGIWLALQEDDLVKIGGSPELVRLTDRGRVLVEHILALPLPTLAWRMPGVSAPPMPVNPHSPRADSRSGYERGFELEGTLPGGLVFVDADGPAPPKPPIPKPIPGIVPAGDPAQRGQQALQLLNAGYGSSEVAQTLEMEQADVERIFFQGA